MTRINRRPRPGFCNAAALATLALLSFSSSMAGVNQWTKSGPDGGQAINLAWHPSRPAVAFASVGQHVYRSVDSGDHWSEVSPVVNYAANVAFDPLNADRMLVASQPLYRSDDGGASFQAASSLPDNQSASRIVISGDGAEVYAASNGRVYLSSDFAQTWVERSTNLPGPLPGSEPATDLKVNAANRNHLYAAFGSQGLFKTVDGGAIWQPITPATGYVFQIAVNPHNFANLVASAGTNIWSSTDAGVSWTARTGGYFSWIEFDPLVPNRVFAAHVEGSAFEVSLDGGITWNVTTSPPSVQIYGGAISGTTAGLVLVGTTEGVYRSNDGGQTYSYRSVGIREADNRALAVSRSAPFQVYASFYNGPEGVHRRVNAAWQPTNVAQLRGVLQRPFVIEALAVDPDNSSLVYAGGYGGVARSTDAGSSWVVTSAAFNGHWVRAVAVDPSNPQILYAASTTLGIMRSVNGGATWLPRNTGLPTVGADVPMVWVVLNPANSTEVYAAQQGSGSLYRSTDSGLTWSAVAAGLPSNEQMQSMGFDPLDANRVYAGTNNRLYRSLNAGLNWTAMPSLSAGKSIASILIDPTLPDVITLVINSGASGLMRTVDGGIGWELAAYAPTDAIPLILRAALDPSQPGNFIAGGIRRAMLEFQIAPDLAITMTGLQDRYPLGSAPMLTLVAQNNGPYAASDARVTLNLPAAIVAGTATSTRGACALSGVAPNVQLRCALGALKVGQSATITLPTTVVAGTGAAVAAVSAHEPDANPTNNTVSASTTVQTTADLAVTLSSASTTIDRGGAVAFTLRVTNSGPNDVPAVFGFTPAAGIGQYNISGDSSGCAPNGAQIRCVASPIAAGGSLTLNVAAMATQAGVQEIVAGVGVGTTTYDPNTVNNAASLSFTVKPVADLGVAMTPPADLQVGQSGTATVTASNAGGDNAAIASVTITAANLNLVSAVPGSGTCAITGAIASCSLGALPVSGSQNIVLNYSAAAAGAASLAASIQFEGTDSASGNNAVARTFTVTAAPAAGGGTGGGGGAGGGGGRLDVSTLLGLLVIAAWCRSQRRSRSA